MLGVKLVQKILAGAVTSAALVTLVGFSSAHADLDQIVNQIERTGVARIIVEMEPKQASQSWAAAQTLAAQQEAVRAMRDVLNMSLAYHDISVVDEFASLPFLGVDVDRDKLSALLDLTEVAAIHEVKKERKSLSNSVPSIEVSDVWARGVDGSGMTIAVIDGGIQTDHTMLLGKAVGDACFGSDFGDDTFNQCPSGESPEIAPGAASNCPQGSNRCSHGTHVSSIAVGNNGQRFGVARGANIMPIDVFSRVTDSTICDPDPAPCELTDTLAVLNALDYVNEQAEQYNIVAVNLSLGSGLFSSACDDDPRRVVVDMLKEKGIATVAAAGNDARNDSIHAPACISSALSVGASNNSTGVASFSNFSETLDFLAPGIGIVAAGVTNSFVNRSGTSVAAPHVAGAWALMRQAAPTASFTEIEKALKDTGVQFSREAVNFSVPNIRVNAAINALLSGGSRVFNNVFTSRFKDSGEAYLRFYNGADSADTVELSLRDGTGGEILGSWESPDILPNASLQFDVKLLETDAVTLVGLVSEERTYYNVEVTNAFNGFMQHVLWQPSAGVITNMSSCAGGPAVDTRVLLNVHTSSITNYPSVIRIYNNGTAAAAEMTLYHSLDGQQFGRWVSPVILSGAAIEIAVADLEAELMSTENEADLGAHLNIVLDAGYDGHIQHIVRNELNGVLTDMSSKCDL